jgi:hypothetical protein
VRFRAMPSVRAICVAVVCAIVSAGFGLSFSLIAKVAGPGPAASQSSRSALDPQQDPNGFVRDVLNNEIQVQLHDQSQWSYRVRKLVHGKVKLFLVCETNEGDIERLITVDGQSLDAQRAEAEDHRIQALVNHPDEMRQRRKKQHEDAEQARKLLAAFPDAFRFQYEGSYGNVVKFKFTPNPQFHPSDHREQVFHHMEGQLLLDKQQKRLVQVDGKLTSPVKFGGGLFGHLDQGGTFSVRQEEVRPGYWQTTRLRVQMSGKALFFKTISVQQDETYTDFKPVPASMSLQQAAELLKHDAEVAQQARS